MDNTARIIIVAGVAIALQEYVVPRVAEAMKVRTGASNFLESMKSSLMNWLGNPGEPGLPSSELE